jgi:GTP-binding protein EngB required for normal cell division
MPELNEFHQVKLRVTFEHIDSLLTEAEHILLDSLSNSPFNRHRADSTPVERRVAHDYVVRIRAAMARFMKEQQMLFGERRCDSRVAAHTALRYAAVAVDELHPGLLGGYGKVTDAGQLLLENLRTELRSLIEKLQTYLAVDAHSDLQGRIQRLHKDNDDVRVLGDLAQTITNHGLIEYRSALSAIIDRVEVNSFEIAVFGRVSSGKSSLLNYLLKADYLPVGVTPVTAVPTRISYGKNSQVEIEYLDNPPEIVSLSRLAEFATEQCNPDNVKHVARIHIKTPNPRLETGLAFVDTPGLGSLATAHSPETLAYLPRCDLGLLLVDGSSGMSLEDLVVLDALLNSGGLAMILISKADLFGPAERSRMTGYIARQVEKELELAPPIFVVSVVGESSVLCDIWFKDQLEPLLSSHRKLATALTRRKTETLRSSLVLALEQSLDVRKKPDHDAELENSGINNGFVKVEKAMDGILQRAHALSREITRQAERIGTVTVDGIVEGWRRRSRVEPNQILAAAITELLAQPTAEFRETYEHIRSEAMDALGAAENKFAHGHPTDLPRASGMPPLNASSIAGMVQIKAPTNALFLVWPFAKWRLRRAVHKEKLLHLNEFLDIYSKQLRDWLVESVDALKKSFEMGADMYRMQAQGRQIPISEDRSQISEDLILLKTRES